jgi:hypothetical protein
MTLAAALLGFSGLPNLRDKVEEVSRSKRHIKNWIMKYLKDQASAYNANIFFRDCPSCRVELSLQEEVFLQNFILCSALNFL